MVFKVLFQTALEATPKRETTESIYLGSIKKMPFS